MQDPGAPVLEFTSIHPIYHSLFSPQVVRKASTGFAVTQVQEDQETGLIATFGRL